MLVSWFGWRANFVLMAAVGAFMTVAAWRWIGESNARPDPHALDPGRMARNYGALLGSRTVVGFSVAYAAIFAGMFAFHSGSSFVFIDLLGYGPEIYSLFFTSIVAGYFSGTVVSARITLRVGYGRLVGIGGAIAVAAGGVMLGLALAGVGGAAAILVPQFAFMFGTGLVMPNAIAGALASHPEKAGAASGLFGFAQQVGGAVMVAVLGRLANGTRIPMAACICAGAALCVIAYFGIVPGARSRTAARG